MHFSSHIPKCIASKRTHREFWFYRKLNSYIGIRNFEGADEAVKEVAALYNKGSNNWFWFTESYFYLLMTTLRFHDAQELYTEVTTHARFGAQGDILQEHFEIYNFYLTFALKTLPDYKPAEKPIKFNFEAMVRRADEAKRDKTRHEHGAAICTDHTLIRYSALTIKLTISLEPIQNYRTRHIKASYTEQSNYLFPID